MQVFLHVVLCICTLAHFDLCIHSPLLCFVTCRKASASEQGLPWRRNHHTSDQRKDSQEESWSGVHWPPCQTAHAHSQPWWKGHRSESKHCGSGDRRELWCLCILINSIGTLCQEKENKITCGLHIYLEIQAFLHLLFYKIKKIYRQQYHRHKKIS